MDSFARTELLLGEEAMERLRRAHVAIFGLGGVGGYTAEALVRSGIGHFTLIDNDTVSRTNLNRQIIALEETIGRYKTEVMAERMRSVNPAVRTELRTMFYLPEHAGDFDFTSYDYVVDAVDTVTAKLDIIVRAKEAGVPVISAMGAGNKLDPSRFEVTDLFRTKNDPLAKVMRRELRKRGIESLKVVYSSETPAARFAEDAEEELPPGRRSVPGSVAFVPSVAGLMMAGEVVRDLCGASGE